MAPIGSAMKLVGARVHAYLDYGLVLVYALAPSVLGLEGGAGAACYVLAMSHLAFALMTAYGLGVARAIPFGVHGGVEVAMAIGLVLAPWLLGVSGVARTFFVAVGVLLGLAWFLTDYADLDVALDRESLPRNSII